MLLLSNQLIHLFMFESIEVGLCSFLVPFNRASEVFFTCDFNLLLLVFFKPRRFSCFGENSLSRNWLRSFDDSDRVLDSLINGPFSKLLTENVAEPNESFRDAYLSSAFFDLVLLVFREDLNHSLGEMLQCWSSSESRGILWLFEALVCTQSLFTLLAPSCFVDSEVLLQCS